MYSSKGPLLVDIEHEVTFSSFLLSPSFCFTRFHDFLKKENSMEPFEMKTRLIRIKATASADSLLLDMKLRFKESVKYEWQSGMIQSQICTFRIRSGCRRWITS